MAEFSGFFADINGDREYTTDFLARWVASFIGNGVYNGTLAVTAGNHMQVIIPAGQAWINGYYYRNDGSLALAIANADGVLARKDTVVIRWDINTRDITIKVLTGTPASSPIAPAIVRSAEQYDLKLAEIRIPAGTTAITQALITDCRLDSSACGVVTGIINQVDTSTFYNQIQSDLQEFKNAHTEEFNSWLNQLKSMFNESTEARLQASIDELNKPYQEIVHTDGIATIEPNTTNIFGAITPINATIATPIPGQTCEYIITFESGNIASVINITASADIDWGSLGEPPIPDRNCTHIVIILVIGGHYFGFWR